jgi:hypothetical protein
VLPISTSSEAEQLADPFPFCRAGVAIILAAHLLGGVRLHLRRRSCNAP